jgi:hypothetical protein
MNHDVMPCIVVEVGGIYRPCFMLVVYLLSGLLPYPEEGDRSFVFKISANCGHTVRRHSPDDGAIHIDRLEDPTALGITVHLNGPRLK